MSENHHYQLEVRVTKPMFVGVKLQGMEEFEVTSAPDWWPDAPEGYFSPQTLFISASASCIVLSMFKAAAAMRTEFTDVRFPLTQRCVNVMTRYGSSIEFYFILK